MLETGDGAVGHAALSRVELRAIGDQVRLKIFTQKKMSRIVANCSEFLRIWGTILTERLALFLARACRASRCCRRRGRVRCRGTWPAALC